MSSQVSVYNTIYFKLWIKTCLFRRNSRLFSVEVAWVSPMENINSWGGGSIRTLFLKSIEWISIFDVRKTALVKTFLIWWTRSIVYVRRTWSSDNHTNNYRICLPKCHLISTILLKFLSCWGPHLLDWWLLGFYFVNLTNNENFNKLSSTSCPLNNGWK